MKLSERFFFFFLHFFPSSRIPAHPGCPPLPLSSARLYCSFFGANAALYLLWLSSRPVTLSPLLICRACGRDTGVCAFAKAFGRRRRRHRAHAGAGGSSAAGGEPRRWRRGTLGGPAQWFTVSARPHSPPKYVCYARHWADPISNPALIRTRYLEGRRSGSSKQEHFEPKRHWNYCSSQPVESLTGGRALWVQGRVRGHTGSRDTKRATQISASSLSQLCAPLALPTHGEDATISHSAATVVRA